MRALNKRSKFPTITYPVTPYRTDEHYQWLASLREAKKYVRKAPKEANEFWKV